MNAGWAAVLMVVLLLVLAGVIHLAAIAVCNRPAGRKRRRG
jgi:hypothetical protein